MNGLLTKGLFLVSLIFTTNAMAQSEVSCISHSDLASIASDFSQFNKFLGNLEEYCETDMDKEWLQIANSLQLLKTIQPNEPTLDQGDAFTYKAISEKDWWAYFTKRASKFVIQTNCPAGVVAYVQPFFGQGTINLCTFFFEFATSSQASTMMHEVRHFDGHRHVTCTQGNENGNSGACDGKITGQGSYAISVQTLVGMARASNVNKDEKSLLEAEALYMAFNKFNTVPKVKLSSSIILSNKIGEVYKWAIGQGMTLVKTLTSPAVIVNSANNLTVYPVDASLDAFRMDKSLEVSVKNPGLYAVHYNNESVEDREKYKSISYFGTGGLLKANTLLTLCDRDNLVIGETNLDARGEFQSIISMSVDPQDQERESFLLSEDGELVRYSCQSSSSKVVKFEKSLMKVSSGAMDIVDSFGFNNEQYALLGDGSLAILSITNNVIRIEPLNLPQNNVDFLSATPLSQPEVF